MIWPTSSPVKLTGAHVILVIILLLISTLNFLILTYFYFDF